MGKKRACEGLREPGPNRPFVYLTSTEDRRILQERKEKKEMMQGGL